MSLRVSITLMVLTLFAPLWLQAQGNVTIHGRTEARYKNKTIVATKYQDYMSYELEELGRAQVNKDGKFEMNLPVAYTTQIQLHCEAAQGPMYVQPGAQYHILLNAPDSLQKNAWVEKIRIDFDTLETYDINNLVLDFNSRQDDFMYYNFTLIGKQTFNDRLDTFKIYLSKVYKDVHNPFFSDYVAYSVAETEMMGPARKDETAFLQMIYSKYILNKPVGYHHDRYMSFFNKFYSDMFKMVSTSDEMDLYRGINKYASPKLVKKILEKDVMMKEKRISEMVLLRSLQQEYYNIEFDKEMILTMLDSVANFSAYDEHKTMAKNIKRRLTYLNKGSLSPGYALLNQLDSLVTDEKFKGKFQYIMFWSTDNVQSINEMRLMKGLYEKYKWDVEFVSINVDDDPNLMKNFLRKNPYKWTFLHHGKDKTIRKQYNATGLPQFYLVDPEGMLIQAPALKPSPSGTDKTIDETLHRIQKKLHPDPKWMPGQKTNGGPSGAGDMENSSGAGKAGQAGGKN